MNFTQSGLRGRSPSHAGRSLDFGLLGHRGSEIQKRRPYELFTYRIDAVGESISNSGLAWKPPFFVLLIQWGMAESASEVWRSLEEHFGDPFEAQLDATLKKLVPPSEQDRAFVRDLLREAYLRTRDIPRRGLTQARLHDGLLTGFEELSFQILQCYEEFSVRTRTLCPVRKGSLGYSASVGSHERVLGQLIT